MSQHDSKRVLISRHFGVTKGNNNNNNGKPSLNRNGPSPAAATASMPAGYGGGEHHQPTPAGKTNSFPAVPDDIQTQLLHVGMKARKSVSEGYKQACHFPSYRQQAPIFEDYDDQQMIDDGLSHPAASKLTAHKRTRDDFEPQDDGASNNATRIEYIPPHSVSSQQQSIVNDFENAPFLVSKADL